MGVKIKTIITINASAHRVWGILTNYEAYPNWNPFIRSIKDEVKVGAKITVTIAPPNDKQMTFKPKVLTLIPNKELSWKGQLLLPRVFDGEHKFEIIDHQNGTVSFIQSEEFKGILVPLFKKKLKTNTKNGFQAMNEKLKELAEK